MPSHYMIVDADQKFKIKKYYDLVEESSKLTRIKNYYEAVERLRYELEIATKYHMIADVDVGVFLSGGVDSTAVAALMNKYKSGELNTFTVGFENKTEVFDETGIASRTAQYLRTKHHNIIFRKKDVIDTFNKYVESLDQPSFDGINTYIVSRETSKHMKVALSGLGGDEIFAGYPHFKLALFHN